MRALSILILIFAAGCSTTRQTATRSSPATPPLRTAEDLFRDGQLDSAELALRAILKTDPENPEAQYYLTAVHRSQAANRQLKPRGYYQTIPQQPFY
jgi:hypothetical protein